MISGGRGVPKTRSFISFQDDEIEGDEGAEFVPNDTQDQDESDLRIARALSLGLRARR